MAPLFTLLLINIIAFTTWMGFKNPGFMERVRFSAYAAKTRGELTRTISSCLVHQSWNEFIWLAIALLLFGGTVERWAGGIGFYLIFAWGIIGGNLVAARLNRSDLFFSCFGMAAGVNAILFAFVLVAPHSIILTFPLPIPLPAWAWAFLQLGLTTFGFRSQFDPNRRVANLAGSAAGVGVAALIVWLVFRRFPLFWFIVLLGATLLCLWLVHINRAGLPWGSVLRAKLSLPTRPRAENRPKRRRPPPNIDALLDKISATGLQSLTGEERKELQEHAERNRRG